MKPAIFSSICPTGRKMILRLPDIYLMFFNRVLVHCHETEKTCLAWREAGDKMEMSNAISNQFKHIRIF